MQLSGRPIYELYKHTENAKGKKRKRGQYSRSQRVVREDEEEEVLRLRHNGPRLACFFLAVRALNFVVQQR